MSLANARRSILQHCNTMPISKVTLKYARCSIDADDCCSCVNIKIRCFWCVIPKRFKSYLQNKTHDTDANRRKIYSYFYCIQNYKFDSLEPFAELCMIYIMHYIFYSAFCFEILKWNILMLLNSVYTSLIILAISHLLIQSRSRLSRWYRHSL